MELQRYTNALESQDNRGIIYKIDCEVSGKSYIGKTIQPLKKRMGQHKNKKSYCRALRQAIEEYGWDKFKISIIWEGCSSKLGEMEDIYINDYGTIEPNGYNIQSGGGTSEKYSEISREAMIEKQREISKRRGGVLGYIVENVNKRGITTSWSFAFTRRGEERRVAYPTKEAAIEQQRIYTENPDAYELPEPKRVGNGKGGIYFRKDRNRWAVQPFVDGKMGYIGSYKTREEAEEVLKTYHLEQSGIPEPEHSLKPEPREDVGVTYKQSENMWQAAIWKDKKNRFLGKYKTKEEAINARKMYLADPENFVRPNQRKRNQISTI